MDYSFGEMNLESADDFYEMLINAHEGLSNDQSRQLNSNLVLLLANKIGKKKILKKAIDSARKTVVDK